jgi:hypothetical protein
MRDRVIGTIYPESSAHAAQFSRMISTPRVIRAPVAVAIENGWLQDELKRSRG